MSFEENRLNHSSPYTKEIQMAFPKKVYAGQQSLHRIIDLVSFYQAKRICVISDPGVVSAGLLEGPQALLIDNQCDIFVYQDIPTEPTYQSIRNALSVIEDENPDLILAIGGGSVIDTAKLIAVLLKRPDLIQDLENIPSHRLERVPIIAVPTTSGTGAEATANSVVLFPERALKVGILHPNLIPDAVILDPDLTINLPPGLTATTGVDAFCHAFESYISLKRTEFSQLFSVEAIKLLTGNLDRAYQDGKDPIIRKNMQIASFYAGLCLNSSTTVAVHALSYPLGGKYHIPHGLANAILLPYVADAMKEEIREALTALAPYMLPEYVDSADPDLPQKVIEYLFGWMDRLKIPADLKGFGISQSDLDYLVDNAGKVTRLLSNNPKAFSPDEIRGIYTRLM